MPVQTSFDRGIAPGDPIDSLATPAVIVRTDDMERNIDRFADMAADCGVRLRSHVKNHKIPALAHEQHRRTDEGGVVCQTLEEVEVMAAAGIDDLYLTRMVVSPRKLDRLLRIAEAVESFTATVDCPANLERLAEAARNYGVTVPVVMEVDIGYERTGVPPGDPAADLATAIAETDGVGFAGILAFEGFVRGTADTAEEFEAHSLAAMDRTAETVDRIEAAGLAVREVKVGCTATARFSATHPVVTEINPGTYPFNDVAELGYRGDVIDKTDCAMTIVTTVVSTPTPDRAIVDAGSKSIAIPEGRMPIPKQRSDIDYYDASEEHGWVATSDATEPVSVGDRLELIPPRASPTVNLHDAVIGVRDGEVETVWDVQARGAVR